jgi:TPR repeat protein
MESVSRNPAQVNLPELEFPKFTICERLRALSTTEKVALVGMTLGTIVASIAFPIGIAVTACVIAGGALLLISAIAFTILRCKNSAEAWNALAEAAREEENFELESHYLLKAAVSGHVDAMNQLGNNYHVGQGVMQNKETALLWHLRAASKNDEIALYNVGIYYKNTKDNDLQIQYWTRSANLGYINAITALADLYHDDLNFVKWKELLEKGASLNSLYCIAPLIQCYQYGIGCVKDEDRAFEIASKHYDKINKITFEERLSKPFLYESDYTLIFILAMQYKLGSGIESNPGKADKLFNEAYLLALRRDTFEGKNGHTSYFLADCSRTGRGTEKNKKKAFIAFEKIAYDGVHRADAKAHLGNYYEKGIGEFLPQDLEIAKKLYNESAEEGSGMGIFELAFFNMQNSNEPETYEPVFKEIFKGLEFHGNMGSEQVDYYLSLCYLYGLGTSVRSQKGEKLYDRVITSGYSSIKKHRDIMDRKG